MNDIMKTALRIALFIVSACLLAWAVIPEGRTIAAGLVLGMAAGSLNALLLRRRVEWVGQVAAGQGARKMGLGMAGRLATVLLAVMIAYKNPEYFSLPFTLSACFIMPFVILASGFVVNKRHSNGKG
ncbi:ATP synthase subunit I [Paenibacillus beijingensis]|uniref:ATP synthase subunit I n=1 Tax=Paenibacillus beijingensis TaxID=1126833 RepID=A0A0D5NHW1_9BACL|nr:ATP synthase subunit I [Paenibacillus beijingensis]AJY74567.1 ATP synthase subunit I [Paenibacillus beijingensis]